MVRLGSFYGSANLKSILQEAQPTLRFAHVLRTFYALLYTPGWAQFTAAFPPRVTNENITQQTL